jgi:hypothetical protein
MSPELDAKLCSDYPEIFQDRNADLRSTALVWGMECGDGWYPLIDELCRKLSSEVRALTRDIAHLEKQLKITDRTSWQPWQLELYTDENLEQRRQQLTQALNKIPRAVQVKEKFAGLRFYVRGATTEQYQLIEFAEALSYRICESCGSMKDTRVYRLGWWRTLCPEHAQAQYGADAVTDYLLEDSC